MWGNRKLDWTALNDEHLLSHRIRNQQTDSSRATPFSCSVSHQGCSYFPSSALCCLFRSILVFRHTHGCKMAAICNNTSALPVSLLRRKKPDSGNVPASISSDLTAQRNHIDIPKPISSNRNRITVTGFMKHKVEWKKITFICRNLGFL